VPEPKLGLLKKQQNARRLEVKMKKRTFLLWAFLLVVLTLEGCATIRGLGEDIQRLGRALKRAVSE
jgi:predicted small secreted protein